MGFLDYAWSISLQKDNIKARIRIDPKLQQPILTQDKAGFNVTLPLPVLSEHEEEGEEEKTISFLGYEFPADDTGRAKVGRDGNVTFVAKKSALLNGIIEMVDIIVAKDTIKRIWK